MRMRWMPWAGLLILASSGWGLAEEAPKVEGEEVTVAGRLQGAPKDAKEGVLAVLKVSADAAKGTPARTLHVRAQGAVADLVRTVLKDIEGKRALVTITGQEKDGDLTVTKQIKVFQVGINKKEQEENKSAEKIAK